MIRFSLAHPTYRNKGLKLALMFPELGGYPNGHEVMCFSENETISPEIEEVMGEVTRCVLLSSLLSPFPPHCEVTC